MKKIISWISSAGIAVCWLYLTSKIGWAGLITGFGLTVLTMVAMGCRISIKRGNKDE